MRFLLLILLTLSISLQGHTQESDYYFPAKNEQWLTKKPGDYNINTARLDEAVEYAKANEYSGSRDLRIAILKGFEREPFHEILGPTKKRGGPAGLILKKGYQIAS